MHTLPETLSERLTTAVRDWAPQSDQRRGREGAARTFQRAMSEQLTGGRAGESYRAVLNYLNGESEPSLDWLRKAAAVLDVRFSWLVAGEGGRWAQSEEWDKIMDEAICEEFPEFARLTPPRRVLAREHVLLLMLYQEPSASESLAVRREAAKQLGRAFASPLEHLAIDATKIPLRALAPYVTGVCQAVQNLLAYIDEPGVVGQWATTLDDPRTED